MVPPYYTIRRNILTYAEYTDIISLTNGFAVKSDMVVWLRYHQSLYGIGVPYRNCLYCTTKESVIGVTDSFFCVLFHDSIKTNTLQQKNMSVYIINKFTNLFSPQRQTNHHNTLWLHKTGSTLPVHDFHPSLLHHGSAASLVHVFFVCCCVIFYENTKTKPFTPISCTLPPKPLTSCHKTISQALYFAF